MKHTIIATTLLAALLGTVASAQEAVTDPVGFVSRTAPANSDCPIGLPLARAAALQTQVSSVAGNVITVGAAMTASAFVYSSPTQTNRYYVSVKDTASPTSTVKGKWFEVLSNSATTITVDPGTTANIQTQGLTAGDTVEVIPFWTLNTLFPSGQSITATADIDVPQDIIFQLPQTVAGINLSASKGAIYSTDVANLGAVGWYDSSTYAPVGDDLILPDSYLLMRNKGAAQALSIVGSVPMGTSKATSIVRLANNQRQDNFAINPFPVAISLTELGLIESNAFQTTTDIDVPKDTVSVFQGTETGFNIQASKTYIYANDPTNLGVAGWYDSSTFDGPYTITDKLVPAGAAIVIRKAAGPVSEVVWSATRPY